jgi:hypothetical protein
MPFLNAGVLQDCVGSMPFQHSRMRAGVVFMQHLLKHLARAAEVGDIPPGHKYFLLCSYLFCACRNGGTVVSFGRA